MRNWDLALREQLLQVQEIDLKIRAIERKIDEVYRASKEEDPYIVQSKQELVAVEKNISTVEAQNQMYIHTLEDIRTAIKGLATTKSGAPKPRTRSSTEALRIEEEKLSQMVVETQEQAKLLTESRERVLFKIEQRSLVVESIQQGPEAEIRKLRAKISRLDKLRRKATSGVPSMLLHKYDRLRSSRSGIGLTILKDGVCTICRMQMPTATVSQPIYITFFNEDISEVAFLAGS